MFDFLLGVKLKHAFKPELASIISDQMHKLKFGFLTAHFLCRLQACRLSCNDFLCIHDLKIEEIVNFYENKDPHRGLNSRRSP